jgi:ABC-type transport system involved in multi-copper enzyme maturation permease subunit
MTRALLRTIVGRKGSFLGTAGVALGAVVVVAVVLAVVHTLRPGRNPSMGGQPMLDGLSGAVWLLGGVGAIVIGALAGSYDVAQGTMRYLVLTGVRRMALYAARTVALVAAVLLALGPALGVGLVLVFVLPSKDEVHVNASEVGDVVWTCLLWPTVFALIAMGIGSLLRSNGAAVAISLFFAFAAAPLLGLVHAASPTLGDLMLLPALDRITGANEGAPLAAAAVAVGVWVAVFWAAGAVRIARDEY